MSTDLETLFSSTARVQILGLFLHNPGSQYYQRELERETGQPIRAVQREVERLEGIGLLLRCAEGNRVFYRLNPDFHLVAELTALFHKAKVEGGAVALANAQPPGGLAVERPLSSPLPAGQQPFAWMETPAQPPLPSTLRKIQVEGEWDQAY